MTAIARKFSALYTDHDLITLALLCVGMAVRLAWALAETPFTYDETFTLLLAKGSFANLIAGTAGDVHPPLFYVLEWSAVHVFGDGSLFVRWYSFLFGCLAIWAASELAQTLKLNARAELWAVALTALLPFQVLYSGDARMYPLLQWLILWAVIAIINRRWMFVALCGVALFYTHNYAVVYWPVLLALAVAREATQTAKHVAPWPAYWKTTAPVPQQSNFKMLLVAFVVPGLVYLPWASRLLWQVQDLSASGYWIPPLSLAGWLYPVSFWWWGVRVPSPLSEAGALLAFALLGFVAYRTLMQRDRVGLTLAALVFGPMLVAGAVSVLWQSIYLHRALIGCAVPLYLWVGHVLSRCDAKKTALVWMCVGVIAAFGLWPPAQPQPATIRDYIADHAAPGDVVYHGNVSSWMDFHSVAFRDDVAQYLMPPVPGSVGTLTAPTRAALGMDELPFDQVNARRVWLVWGAPPTIAQAEDEAIAEILRSYPNTQIFDLKDFLPNDASLIDGGLWEVTK